MKLNDKEVAALRELARTFAEIAADPVHEEKRRQWRAFNACKGDKPMVLMDQLPWEELEDKDPFLKQQVTSDGTWGWVERVLRRTIYQWKHMPVDMIVNPYILIPRPIESTGYGIDVNMDIGEPIHAGGVVGQYFHSQIETMEDVEKIKMPELTLNAVREQELIAEAHFLFDGICEFRLIGSNMHLGVWDKISMWMGVENCYINIIEQPELVHAVMERMTDALIYEIGQRNALNAWDVYSDITHCSVTCSDYLPSGDGIAHPKSYNVWSMGLAQLFTSVSPAVTNEFEVEYMKRVFPYFGAIYYGCCDRLDDRLDIITRMPNIRKISCSPWSDRENFAAKLPRGYIMSNKPSPAFLAGDHMNETAVREDLQRTIDAAKAHNVPLEMILKDVSTIRCDPERLWRWAEIARDVTEKARG